MQMLTRMGPSPRLHRPAFTAGLAGGLTNGVDGRGNGFEWDIQICQRFCVAGKQVTTWLEAGDHTVHDILFAGVIEADQDIAQEDDVKLPDFRQILRQIRPLKCTRARKGLSISK